jgi:hypothetical protein
MRVLRFKHVKERGIVNNRVQLHSLIKKCGFPAGQMMGKPGEPGSNTRFWDEEKVNDWLASRPEGKQTPRGFHKRRRKRTPKIAEGTR